MQEEFKFLAKPVQEEEDEWDDEDPDKDNDPEDDDDDFQSSFYFILIETFLFREILVYL